MENEDPLILSVAFRIHLKATPRCCVSKALKEKIKAFCDKNYKETASNFVGSSGVDMIVGSEYYNTYGDVFGRDGYGQDDDLFTDYGQKWNGRQFFKHDFMPKFTDSLTNSSF